ncbi:sigma-70 family RNA polymerase sigma factor [Candidatus Poribacteria bacterium]
MRTDDGSIIYECLNGEPEAFGVLVDKYKEGIYAFVYHKLRDFQDAQDVTQEVFLQAYRGLRSLRRWESFGFWLYRIAYARSSQWLRTRSKRVDREFIEDQDSRVMDAGSLDSYRDGQLSQSLREALDSLPEIHREVLTLYYFGGMNSKEIARAFGTSPGAVRVRLSRARAQLREEMVDMMDTAFESQKIPAGFTLRIVEAVRRIKINPTPRAAGLPWGLSLAAGIIVAVLVLNPHLSIPSDMANPAGSPLPVETKVLKTGEIPVDVLEASQISVIASKQGDGDGGVPQPDPQNALMLAPQAKDGTWTEKADMPTARNMLSTCVVEGKIYAIGGCTPQNQYFATVEVYDPATDTWTKEKNMPTARLLDHAACVVNGKIYAMGGYNGQMLSTLEEYDPKTDTWTRKADVLTPRCHMSISAVNGKIYAIGGCNQGPAYPSLSIVEEYDPATNIWTKKADIPTSRSGLDTAVVNGKIYAIGGITGPWHFEDGGIALSSVEEYDPTTDTWARKADMPVETYGLAASALNGKIYVVGGASKGRALSSILEYDPKTDTWRELADMPTRRAYLSSATVDGKLYAIGGLVGDVAFPTVEEYDPEGWQAASPQGKLPTKWGEVKSD